MALLRGIEDKKRLDELTGVENLSPLLMVAEEQGAASAREVRREARRQRQ